MLPGSDRKSLQDLGSRDINNICWNNDPRSAEMVRQHLYIISSKKTSLWNYVEENQVKCLIVANVIETGIVLMERLVIVSGRHTGCEFQ